MTADGRRRFFAYARARHEIHLRRQAGDPPPWSKDPILQKYRFCCVFREDDRTTRWFRGTVRDRLRDEPEVLLATVIFRMLNRIATGQAMFCQQDIEYGSAFEQFLKTRDARVLKHDILALCGDGPYVTGAYMISSPAGYSKLDGVLKVLQDFARDSEWERVATGMLTSRGMRNPWALQQAHAWFKKIPWFGDFHSYEIVTDLRHTALLDHAPDVMTWCNVGPGARRGLDRIAGRELKGGRHPRKTVKDEQLLAEMRELLEFARTDARFWPQPTGSDGHAMFTTGRKRGLTVLSAADWPAWEMREVEHTLCEFDKYERTRLGEGTPRGRYP